MSTFGIVLIFGMLGLVMDVGWGFFVHKTAQASADAAALAAVRKAYSTLGQQGSYTCGSNLDCQATAVTCSSLSNNSNLYNGCQYAQQNFTVGSSSRRNLMMSSGTNSPFVTASGNVEVKYWVTATAAQQLPQLFSAVLGNMTMTSSARATAGIVTQIVDGSLILLNRRHDRTVFGNTDYYGVNLLVQANDNQGHYALQTSGSIRMSSTCNGTSLGNGDCQAGNRPAYAGVNQGGGTVHSPSTTIAGSGWYQVQGSSQWTQTPSNGAPALNDPMSGKGQPPIPSIGLSVPVPGGTIDDTICPGGLCLPGKYYAVPAGCQLNCAATGDPLTVNGNVHFLACSGCAADSNFGGYIFFGGLTARSGGANVTFDPGVYVFAGAKPSNNSPGALLDTSTNMNLTDYTTSTSANTADAGEVFVFTGADSGGTFRYPGLSSQVPSAVSANGSLFQMGTVNLQSGNNSTTINLHGLNPNHALIRNTPLETFAPTLFWQDQNNTSVKYDSNGRVDFSSCGSGYTLNNPCTNSLANNASPELDIQASPNIHLYGVLYQPRGAWTTLVGGGGYSGPLQLITGAVNVQGNANISLLGLSSPITATVAALIE